MTRAKTHGLALGWVRPKPLPLNQRAGGALKSRRAGSPIRRSLRVVLLRVVLLRKVLLLRTLGGVAAHRGGLEVEPGTPEAYQDPGSALVRAQSSLMVCNSSTGSKTLTYVLSPSPWAALTAPATMSASHSSTSPSRPLNGRAKSARIAGLSVP